MILQTSTALFTLFSLASARSLCRSTSTATFGAEFKVVSKSALDWYDPDSQGTAGRDDPSSGYACLSGPPSNFPDMSTWVNYDTMWTVNNASLVQGTDTLDEIQDLHDSIDAVSQKAQIDKRVILAMVMKESSGNVRIKCTNNGVMNCGLLQSFNATDQSYDPSNPTASITQMLVDGIQGTPTGPGLAQHLSNKTTTDNNLYTAFRMYNSGSANLEDLSDPVGATANYVSDLANYLQGWNGAGEGSTTCGFATA